MKKLIFLSFLSLLIFSNVACQSTKPTIVKLMIDETVEIKDSKVKVTVYGYNPWMADVSADVVHIQEFEIAQLPETIKLEVPEKAREKVNYLSEGDEPNYYLSFNWDSNGDEESRAIGDLFPKEIAPRIKLYQKNEMMLKVLKD